MMHDKHLQKKRAIETLLLVLWVLFFPGVPGSPASDGASFTGSDVTSGKGTWAIPLNVHVGETRRDANAWVTVVEEINRIWFSQARICFDTRLTGSDDPAGQGFDLWFSPQADGMNGYYVHAHDMRVREDPDLAPVDLPARHPAARTAAHELGHALGLPHRQDSDENLMRSKTLGWQLSADEIRMARAGASTKGVFFPAGHACTVHMSGPGEAGAQ